MKIQKKSFKVVLQISMVFAVGFLMLAFWAIMYRALTNPRDVASTIQRKKPHIIVIMADDLGWNDVSYHGSNEIPTPNIDALAYAGVMLRNYYVLPSCTPSRTAFLTGNYAVRSGMQGRPLSANQPDGLPLNFTLFPEHFRNLGYETHLIGKWHVGYYAEPFLPTSRGFDDFFGYYNAFMTYFTYIIRDPVWGFPGYDLHRDVGSNRTVDWTPKNVYATDLFTAEAERVIADHNTSVPLYLHFAQIAAHTSTPKGCYEPRDVEAVNAKFAYIRDDSRRLYAGVVSSMDESVGRVVEALNKRGMLEDSVIVFTSDNGALARAGNRPYRGTKYSLFEGGVRVPALVWSPMIENSSRIHTDYFHITDWLPTLYYLAGGNMEDLGFTDGVDQWESISKGTPSLRYSMLLNIDETTNASGAIKGRFKYVTGTIDDAKGDNPDDGDSSIPPYDVTAVTNSMAALAISGRNGSATVELDKIRKLRSANKVTCSFRVVEPANCTDSCLFDIAADPCETTDVSGRYPEVRKELQDLIADFWDVLVPQKNSDRDPRGLPDYEGGPWLPWMTVDGEYLPRPLYKDDSAPPPFYSESKSGC